jgi:allophanate hydrolase subunit 2
VPEVLGSKSTYTLTGLGGYQGRKLTAGDELSLGEAPPGSGRRAGRAVSQSHRPTLSRFTELRTIPGLCGYRVKPESMRDFLESEWVVAPAADRVGYRYRGIELEFVERDPPFGAGSDPSNVVDVGYPIGSIQVPGGVEPIVLLNDAVTGGGYATIGTVISPDRDRLAQTRTHGKTRFDSVTLEQALQVRADRRRRLDRLRGELAA